MVLGQARSADGSYYPSAGSCSVSGFGLTANCAGVTLPADRMTHVYDGDATGGGHKYGGDPGKSWFPATWSKADVQHAIDRAADKAPTDADWNPQPNGNYVTHKWYNGVLIRVVVYPDYRLTTAVPIRGNPGSGVSYIDPATGTRVYY